MTYRVWVSESKGNVGPAEPYVPHDFSTKGDADAFCKRSNGPVSHAYIEPIDGSHDGKGAKP